MVGEHCQLNITSDEYLSVVVNYVHRMLKKLVSIECEFLSRINMNNVR